MIGAFLTKRRTKAVAAVPPSNDTVLAALDQQVVALDAEAVDPVERLDRRRASATEADDALNALARNADDSPAARGRYKRQQRRCRELADLVDAGERAVRHLDVVREQLLFERTELTERIAGERRAAVYAEASADLLAATEKADAANETAVQAVEDVLTIFARYRAAAREVNVAAPGTFPVRIALSSHWTTPALMALMGTTLELSVSVSAAANRMKFADVVSFLKKDQQ